MSVLIWMVFLLEVYLVLLSSGLGLGLVLVVVIGWLLLGCEYVVVVEEFGVLLVVV